MGERNFDLLAAIKQLPNWLVILTVVGPAFLFYLGWELATPTGFSTTVYVFHNSIYVLTTISRGLATIFGITFSVLFLGIQLVSTRYTERVVKFLLSDSVLHIVLVVFLISISLPMWILYNSSDLKGPLSVAFVFTSSGFGFIALVYLYVFAKRILRETTPERLLNRAIESTDISGELEDQTRVGYRKQISGILPVSLPPFSSQVQDNAEHPTLHLSSMVTSSLQDERHQDAENIFGQYISILFDEVDSWTESDVSSQAWCDTLEPILRGHLPSIIENGAISGSSGVMLDAIAAQRQLYLHATNHGIDISPKSLRDGYISVMHALPLTQDNMIFHRETLVQMCSVISEAISQGILPRAKADQPTYLEDFPLVLDAASEQVDNVLDESVDNDLICRICIGVLQELVPLQTHLLKLGEDLEEAASQGVAQGWRGEGLKSELLSEWGKILMQTSIGIVDIRHDIDRKVSYKSIWEEICIQSVVHSADGYPRRVIFSMIELIMIDVSNSPPQDRTQVIQDWAETLAQVQLIDGKDLISDEIESFSREIIKQQDGYISKSETHNVFVDYDTTLSTADINEILNQLSTQLEKEYRRTTWEAEDITDIRERAAHSRLGMIGGWMPATLVSNDAFRFAPSGTPVQKYFRCMKSVAKSDLSSLRKQSDRIASRKSGSQDLDYTILVAEKPSNRVKGQAELVGVNIEPLELEDLEGQKHLTLDYFINPTTTAHTIEIDESST